jgi:hypothetical protein
VRDASHNGSSPAIDLDGLRADPKLVDQLDMKALVNVLDWCAEERDRLGIVERRAQTRLREELHHGASPRDDFPADNDELVDDAQAGGS